ncbi:WcaF family extracellular polysaccharide biosynthesis acetyltransferase [Bradyrhizobium sp. CCBAU 51765]|uniref:WcaF family extracellular polysaccharide biosynthesis acetyltransferase n=1 Tax=Bradyrhizobium sp. CCBAU 51765 TaxID=1325102 RepID=UPI001886ED68|nr:WcaF family extracellular polysaccharide biosynthesis acetyltransferase [Bradyrhizobium sp. CCBAU 51765]QOZ11547.1 colanic acid biosynthesis acetyltransferase WcaF [Bradyrhizobium sp. CCBAU 51765]
MREFQKLDQFRVPPGFRGRGAVVVLLWQVVQSTLFALSPQPFFAWRRFLLRLFGAKIGRKVLLRPTVRVTYPWKTEIGDYSWIGDHVELYSLDCISIGSHSVISQRSYLCTGSHDMADLAFSYITAPITVGDQVWIASDVFVAPGVKVGRGAVVGARSTVREDVPPEVVAIGEPARVVRDRLASDGDQSCNAISEPSDPRH